VGDRNPLLPSLPPSLPPSASYERVSFHWVLHSLFARRALSTDPFLLPAPPPSLLPPPAQPPFTCCVVSLALLPPTQQELFGSLVRHMGGESTRKLTWR